MANRLEQLDQLQARKQQMLNKARITASLIEPIPRTVILAELINNMPKTMSLLDFKLDQKIIKKRVPRPKTAIEKAKRQLSKNKQSAADGLNSALTREIHDSEIKLQLTGVATTDVQVAQFMAALNNVPLFDDLSLKVSEDAKINKEIMRKFTVELMVDGESDIKLNILEIFFSKIFEHCLYFVKNRVRTCAIGKEKDPVEAPITL